MAKIARTRRRRRQLSDRHESRRRSVAGARSTRRRPATSSSRCRRVDLGQGLKTVMAQICAETLGVPLEMIIVDTADTDTGPHCMGTFASRGTHRVGNAIIMAAKEAREVLLEVAAEELEVDAGRSRDRRQGQHPVEGIAPAKHDSVVRDWRWRRISSTGGRSRAAACSSSRNPSPCRRPGRWTRDSATRTPARSPRSRSTTRRARSTCCRLKNVYEIGRALNPAMVEQQIVGGAWMGISHALYETTEPYYPDAGARPDRFQRIPDAGAGRSAGDRERHSGAAVRRRAVRRAKGSAR